MAHLLTLATTAGGVTFSLISTLALVASLAKNTDRRDAAYRALALLLAPRQRADQRRRRLRCGGSCVSGGPIHDEVALVGTHDELPPVCRTP